MNETENVDLLCEEGGLVMSEAYEKIMEFVNSYRGTDFLEKNKEVFEENKKGLEENEKEALAKELCVKGGIQRYCAWVEVMELELHIDDSIQNMFLIFEANKRTIDLISLQKIIIEGIDFIITKLPETVRNEFLSEMLILSTKYRCIYIVQHLMEKGAKTDYTNQDNESIQSLISNMKDKTMVEYLQYYIQNGQIKEDSNVYFRSGEYTPEYYEEDVDYFATKGLEVCKEILKSYRKSKLLNKQTSLQELNDFIDNKYNWDDGVEVPYFIMHHKNCDLNLRKKLFELGAGDCIDEDTYVNTRKDPWKQFILELDEMIKEEEK